MLRDGITTRTGAITADSGCVSPQRHRDGGTDNRYAARATGSYTLTVTADLDVHITGLNGATRIGAGDAEDRFTVAPADARCTTTTGTVTEGANGKRTLTVNLTRLGATTATVTCTRTNYGTATGTSTLRALAPVADVTARSGGECTLHGGALDAGIDKQYDCTLTRGATLTLGAQATGHSAQTMLGWAAATGVRALPVNRGLGASVIGNRVVFARSHTATVTCTASADITLTARVGLTARHTTKIAVACKPPVQITNYSPGSRDGAGAMTGSFNVAPAAAACTARNAGGIAGRPAPPAGAGTARTVAVTSAGTGILDVEVRCGSTGYAATTATARFVARDEAVCRTSLGTLRHGARTFVASLSATSCTSRQRSPGSSSTFRAHRYTFTLASAGRISVRLEPTGSGNAALDTYLLLLGGHGSDGTVLHSHDNQRGNATRLDSVLLSAGDYTIEATTALSNAIGGYRLRVEADFAAQPTGLPATVNATVGQTKKHRFSYRLHDAAVTVQSVTPTGLTATLTAVRGTAVVDLTPDKARTSTVTIAITASGRTTTRAITVNAACQTGYRPGNPDSDTRKFCVSGVV